MAEELELKPQPIVSSFKKENYKYSAKCDLTISESNLANDLYHVVFLGVQLLLIALMRTSHTSARRYTTPTFQQQRQYDTINFCCQAFEATKTPGKAC